MKQVYFFLFLILFNSIQLTGQEKLSAKATVNVITCGAGSELYTAFGHSAFRIYDPIKGIDKIYNYGTFNFNAPNFYLNFAKGKLTYQLSTSNFNYFLRAYQYEKRWVKNQVLNLTTNEVQQVYEFLEINAKPENKNYQYDFFYDNCSTKIEEVIKTVLAKKVTFSSNHITTHKSHRDLIEDYTKHFKWGKFGIDLALGSVIDVEATKDEYKFLPDYIFKAFEHATIKKGDLTEPLVFKEFEILKEPNPKKNTSFLSPFNVFLAFSLLIVFSTFKNYKQAKRSKWLDFLLFVITGIIGIAVLLLWFATSHTATYKNYNFLWAFAPNFFVAFIVLKNKIPFWVNNYLKLLLLLTLIMAVFWILKFQVFNIALLPLVLALAIRYLYLIKTNHS